MIRKHRILPDLNDKSIKEVFSHVYDMQISRVAADRSQIENIIPVVLTYRDHILVHRREVALELLSFSENIVEDFEINSEGTILWLSTVTAIKELYNLSDAETKELYNIAKAFG